MIPETHDEPLSFGDWLAERRRALDLTQARLASRVGCAAVTIKKIERGERRPSRQLAQLLAEELAIPQAERDAFVRMARGRLAPVQAPVRPPEFLKDNKKAAAQSRFAHFVARERELAWLDTHLAAAMAGNGRAVFVVGEAGQGKTSLLAEFARRAQAAEPGLIAAGSRCHAAAGVADPYLPFRDLLGLLCGDLQLRWAAGDLTREQALRLWSLFPAAVQALLDHGPHLIDRLLPAPALLHRISTYLPGRTDWLADLQTRRASPEGPAQAAVDNHLPVEVVQVLVAYAVRHPLLLLLDDLQWVDEASAGLLFRLGRRLAGSRILLLGAYRPVEVGLGYAAGPAVHNHHHALTPVIGEFKRAFGDIELDLDRQHAPERRAFVDALVDSEPNHLDESFRERLFLHTQGQPLFTVEMLRDMQAGGFLIRNEAGQWVENAGAFPQALPARVEAVIEQRIERLEESLQRLLEVASVQGEVFSAQVVALAEGLDDRLVLRRLTHDLEQGHRLVREQPEVIACGQPANRYRFEHALFQEYLYARLSQGGRRLLHHRVAQATEMLLDDDARRFIAGLLEDGARAAANLDAPYPACLVEFGPALLHHSWHGQDWARAAVYALYVGNAALRVYALREAMAAFERAGQALARLPAPAYELAFEALVRWQEAAFKFKPYDEQLQQLARAEEIARRYQDKRRLIRALHAAANVHLARGLWMRAGPALMECLALAQELSDERLAVRPTYFKALMTTLVSPRDALDELAVALQLTRTYEDRHVEALVLGTTGQMYGQLGEYSRAVEAMQRAHEALQRTDSPLTESDVELLTAWTYLAMGDVEQGLAHGRRSVEKALATDNMDCICYGFDCVGFANLELQNFDEAGRAFAEAVSRSQATGAVIPQWLGQAGLAMAQFSQGRREAVGDLEDAVSELQRYHNAVGAAEAARMLSVCLMESGDLDAAEDYLTQALACYRRTAMRPYLVRALYTLADLRSRQAQPAAARDAQAEAEALMATLAADLPAS